MSTTSPFDPVFDDLPQTLPIFPLNGVLLLPRGRLPLNIFEPRYLSMVQDALRTDRLIGMIQPCGAGDPPPVFSTGCAGRITSFTESEDGRYLITLTGVCRFTVEQELETARGYRRIVARWDKFRNDMEKMVSPDLDRPRLTALLQAYFHKQGLSVDWDTIKDAPDERLTTCLAMICPFEPNEKQALLEAPDLAARAEILLKLLQMAVVAQPEPDHARH